MSSLRPSGTSAIIIIDMWETLMPNDRDKHWMKRDITALGEIIHSVVKWEKSFYNTDSYISVGGGDNIIERLSNIQRLDSINDIVDLPLYDNYYFCGTHLSRCVNRDAGKLIRTIGEKANIGILANLCLPYPTEEGEMQQAHKDFISINGEQAELHIPLYYWGYHQIMPMRIENNNG